MATGSLNLICLILLWQHISQLTGQITETPPNFPQGIAIRRDDYQNWSNEITVKDVWIATPKNVGDVLLIVNYAYRNGYVVRAVGFRHGFSPLVLTNKSNKDRNILVETTKYLTNMEMISSPNESAQIVKVQTGASMDNLLEFLEENDCGMAHVPAPGQITLGGVLAVGAHGAAIPALGEVNPQGLEFGTISNSIITLTAVVWDETGSEYVLKTFNRSDPIIRALMIHLGRSFITEVTMSVGKNYYLRCESFFDINSKELYAPPGSYTPFSRTFSSFVDRTGRIDAIAFGDSELNWVKVWSVSSRKPLLSREVKNPYNYIFGNYIPEPVADLYAKIAAGAWALTTTLATTQHAVALSTTTGTFSADIWGLSKNTMLYVKSVTLIEVTNGYVVLTKRGNIQKVVSIIAEYYGYIQKEYAKMGKYPINGHMQMRVTLVDDEGFPYLSPVGLIPGYEEYNIGVWLAITSQSYQLGLHEAMRELESFIFKTFPVNPATTDPIGFARGEWAKGLAYTSEEGAWTNVTVLNEIIPATYPEWNRAIETLDRCDPNLVFANDFARQYFVIR